MAVPDISGAWNSHDAAKVAAMFAEDGVRWEPAFPGRRLEGRSAIEQGVAGYQLTAAPSADVTVRNVVEGSDGTIVVEWTWAGIHENDIPNLPAKGEQLDLVGVSVCEMEGDLIKEERVYWDTATLMAQAGVMG